MRRPSLEISARASSRASSRSRDPRSPTHLPSFLARAHGAHARDGDARARRTPDPSFPAPRRLDDRGHEWGETSARLRARFAAAHGLDGVRFRPFGEALLDAEDPARDASRAAPPLARRDDAGWPDDAPAGDAAAGLLLGRLKSTSTPSRTTSARRRRRQRARTTTTDLDLLDALPPGADPIDASPPRVTLRKARSMQTRDARRAPPLALRALPRRARSTRWTTTRSCRRGRRAWCGPPAASFARASPRPNPSDRHSGVVFPNETPPRIGTWTDRGSTGLDSCPTTRPTSPYCVSDTRRR